MLICLNRDLWFAFGMIVLWLIAASVDRAGVKASFSLTARTWDATGPSALS